MTPSFLPTRDFAEGAAWGLVIGALGGVILVGDTVTAEAGQVLWLMTVAAGALVISPAGRGSAGSSVGACLPFFAALLGVLAWSGAAGLAWSVGKVIVIRHVSIPLAAATDREMAFRYGIFFLFVLLASLPAVIGFLITWQGVAGAVRKLVVGSAPRAGQGPRIEAVFRLAIRVAVCAGMLALASLS